jgi:hypothetical protein
MTAQQKQNMACTFSLLPPYFDRCCLAVCSWAGGLHGLWPLITASLDLLQSPSCCTPGQPVAFPWYRFTPADCVAQILGNLCLLSHHLVDLLEDINSKAATQTLQADVSVTQTTPTTQTDGSPGDGGTNLATWLTCLTGPGSQHKGHLKDKAPPSALPPQVSSHDQSNPGYVSLHCNSRR